MSGFDLAWFVLPSSVPAEATARSWTDRNGKMLPIHGGSRRGRARLDAADPAVLHVDDAVAEVEDAAVVGDDDDGAVGLHGDLRGAAP